MVQNTALKGKNGKEVGTKEYFKDVNNRGFMVYLSRESECAYYDMINALCQRMKAPAGEILNDIKKQQKIHPEIFPEDARQNLSCFCQGLADICELVGHTCSDLFKCIQILDGVKCGSKKHTFTYKETEKMYGGVGRLEMYIEKKTRAIFNRSLPAFYKNNGGRRKYGQALKSDLKEIADQLYTDICGGTPGTVAVEDDYQYNILLAEAQLKKCGIQTKGNWKAILSKYSLRDISKELKEMFDEVYQDAQEYRDRSFAEKSLHFVASVGAGKKYDLKNRDGWKDPGFIFDGEIIGRDDPGNILYGYFGKAMHIPDEILLSGAGAAQIVDTLRDGAFPWAFASTYFDDPRDQKMIKLGITLYRQEHAANLQIALQEDLKYEIDRWRRDWRDEMGKWSGDWKDFEQDLEKLFKE